NIIVLGASYSGLSVAHNFLDDLEPRLSALGASNYRLVLVSPSTHFFFNIAAPQALVSPSLIPHHENRPRSPKGRRSSTLSDNLFVPIQPAFAKHPFSRFTFMHGQATEIDHKTRRVTVQVDRTNPVQQIPYHALIIATGSSSHSPLLSLHDTTLKALREFYHKLKNATHIAIVGGGLSGVEIAAQIAQYFDQKRVERSKRRITLISGGTQVLKKLEPSIGKQAEKRLKTLGVHVLPNVRAQTLTRKTRSVECDLDNGQVLSADEVILATGVCPNTRFLPIQVCDKSNYVITDETLRVHGIGDRSYAIGDCASYSDNHILDVYDAVPVLVNNLYKDLLEYQLENSGLESHLKLRNTLEDLRDERYRRQRSTDTGMLLAPMTKYGGVGSVFGWHVPSLMVYLLKGRKYRIDSV
ncbi:FAD/NAD(P)-binding domain-containing protein, partial [Lophiostoma macrostomum CBS 122681]